MDLPFKIDSPQYPLSAPLLLIIIYTVLLLTRRADPTTPLPSKVPFMTIVPKRLPRPTDVEAFGRQTNYNCSLKHKQTAANFFRYVR